jgi:hypothetical protein
MHYNAVRRLEILVSGKKLFRSNEGKVTEILQDPWELLGPSISHKAPRLVNYCPWHQRFLGPYRPAGFMGHCFN